MALFKCQGQILKSVFVSGTNRIGGVLKATVSPVLSIITYQWYRNNEVIPNATNTTYTITGFDVDKQIHCIATLYGHPVDSNWLEKVPTSDVQIISSDDENRVGSSLKVEYSNILSEVTYQWYRDGSAINSAKDSTYWINGLDVGYVISCKLTTSGYSVFSNGSKTIPEPTCSISGSSVVGSELTCSIGNTLSEVTYQWYRGDTAISNANKNKYTITNSDVGYKIKCKINTSNFEATSNESGVVDYNWIGPISEEKKDPNNGDYRNTASVSWSFNPGVRLISAYSEGASSHEENGRAKIYISTSDGRYNNTLVRESEPMNTAWTSWDGDLENVTYVRCEIDGTVNKKNCTGQIKYYKKG